MMTTGWDLFVSMQIDIAEVEAVCVRFNDRFGQVPVDSIEHWLRQMPMFISYEDPAWEGFVSPGRDDDFRFQIWTPERIFFTRELDGIIVLSSVPRTPERWMYINSRTDKNMIEISTGDEWSLGNRV